MEYYSATKNEDILSFAGKWMELENIILSEVTQTQKDMHGMYLQISGYIYICIYIYIYIYIYISQDTVHRTQKGQQAEVLEYASVALDALEREKKAITSGREGDTWEGK
jgi:hypothetical protein